MALEIRQSLNLAQQLIMTPQLQQAIKILQLSRLELVESIYEEMEANPVLEEELGGEAEDNEGNNEVEVEKDAPESETPDLPEVTFEERARDDIDWENYLSEYSTGKSETFYEEREAPPLENIISNTSNLFEHLMWQLNMGEFDEEQKKIGVNIIGNLDKDGYLDSSLEEICEVAECPLEKAQATLCLIQNFDPIGVAVRDAQESLLVQARFQGFEGTLVEKIILDHLGNLETGKYDLIAKCFCIEMQDVLKAVSVIKGMDPKPGRVYSEDETIYIVPEIYVFKVEDDYEIMQNEDGLPKLQINAYYREMLRSRDSVSESAKTYIQEKLRSAAWLIKSIHQRQRTIFRVTKSIVKFQRDFLDHGINRLRPLVLRDVAEDIEMHESTISRVTTNKYVHTPQGVFELKFFFNSAINRVEGDAIASESVKEQIRAVVNSEDKTKPYSDQEIADRMKTMNIDVARRTVAKYRESMGIAASRKRKVRIFT